MTGRRGHAAAAARTEPAGASRGRARPRVGTALAAALVVVGGAAGCGSGGPGGSSTLSTLPSEPTTTTTATTGRADATSLGPKDAEAASGVVTLCGGAPFVAASRDAVTRFTVARAPLQASTLALPGGDARVVRELRDRARTASRECDVLALPSGAVATFAGSGWLADLQPYAEARGDGAPLRAVRVGADVFAIPAAAGPEPRPALAVAAASRNPGGALTLLDALTGGRTIPRSRP